MINLWTAIGTDIVAIVLLSYAVYFRRYYRRDLVLLAAFLFLAVNP